MSEKAMSVKELIVKLNLMPEDAPVKFVSECDNLPVQAVGLRLPDSSDSCSFVILENDPFAEDDIIPQMVFLSQNADAMHKKDMAIKSAMVALLSAEIEIDNPGQSAFQSMVTSKLIKSALNKLKEVAS